MELFNEKVAACFGMEECCENGIFEIAQKVAADMELVSRKRPAVIKGLKQLKKEMAAVAERFREHAVETCERPDENEEQGRSLVLFATVGKSVVLEQLERKGLIDLTKVRGKNEVFAFFVLEGSQSGGNLLDPHGAELFAGTDLAGICSRLLLICGSDKRGTIYGMFHLSEWMGVSPLVYWGDAKPVHKSQMSVGKEIEMISKEPSVRYRGFFINDEWPCFGNWTTSHFGGFTAKMYDHVFELLLRLKGNYLWPAMWSSSFALDGPGEESARLADLYGVIIGNSHHEPCLRAGEEWDVYRGEHSPYGNAWNYATNKEGLLRYWEDGLKRSGSYESIITVGMRGERDSVMEGANTLADHIEILKDIIINQKKMIAKYGRKNGVVQPMMLAIYKEVEKYYYGDEYTPGLREWEGLEDVILMFCEDNFGHMRYLPPKEMPHAAGYGMYFHLDYHGDPISYEWINSTPLTAIWEQMTIAYEQGVKEVWIVNVGDLKGNEFPLSYFLSLAYDFDTWSVPGRTHEFTEQWLRQQFGSQLCDGQIRRLSEILTDGILIIGKRRPEALDAHTYGAGDEAWQMLERLEDLERRLVEMELEIPQAAKSAFYSMIADQLRMGFNLIRMQIYAGLGEHYARQGKVIANQYADCVDMCIRLDRELIEAAGARKNGKWSGMWDTSHVGFKKWNEDGCRYPLIFRVEPFSRPRMVVSRQGENEIYQKNYGTPDCLHIRDLGWKDDGEVVIEIANDGTGSFEFEVEAQESDWFTWEITNQTVTDQEYLYLRRKKKMLPELQDGKIILRSGDTVVEIHIHGDQKKKKIQVLAKDFLRADERILTLADFGKEESAVKAYPFVAQFAPEARPCVTYQLEGCEAGVYELTLFLAPSNPIRPDIPLELLVRNHSVTEEWTKLALLPEHYTAGEGTDRIWAEGVIRQQHQAQTQIDIKNGKNELEICFLDGISVLEKLELEHRVLF